LTIFLVSSEKSALIIHFKKAGSDWTTSESGVSLYLEKLK